MGLCDHSDLHNWLVQLSIYGFNFWHVVVTLFGDLLVVHDLYDWLLQLPLA